MLGSPLDSGDPASPPTGDGPLRIGQNSNFLTPKIDVAAGIN
jgi:hypothetical protein